MRILVVDNDFKTRVKIKRLLSSLGDTDAVSHGEIAFNLFVKAHEESAPYGLIAIERHLPKLDGEALKKKIQDWESENPTAAKKTTAKILLMSAPKEDPLPLTRILAVDDDYVSRTKLKTMLSAYGECDIAPDGANAIRMYQLAHMEKRPYALISMDIEMPGMRGPEVVKKIRDIEADERFNITEETKAKILMITGTSDMGELMSSFDKGCEAYVKKPVSPGTLRIALTNLEFIETEDE